MEPELRVVEDHQSHNDRAADWEDGDKCIETILQISVTSNRFNMIATFKGLACQDKRIELSENRWDVSVKGRQPSCIHMTIEVFNRHLYLL